VIDKIRALAKEYQDLQLSLQDPAIHEDRKRIIEIGRRLKFLEPLVEIIAQYDRAEAAIRFAGEVQEKELKELAELEASEARALLPVLEQKMRSFLVPQDPMDGRNVILEVRAGTGGEEAALFASELLRMYLRYAEEKGWKTEMMSMTEAEGGGVKEVVVRIEGPVFGELKFESGAHRVQRIPSTESKGRVHTSAATVAVLPEAEEVDIQIRPQDLRIDTFRSGGAGGQNVNKVESAIRITHIPTNTVVACQTERSQLRNRELAMNLLRSRIYESERERLAKERGEMRSGQIGTGDRSEKIRTYNFPQDRVTDHRIGQNFSNLPSIMEGGIGDLLQALREKDAEEKLAKAQ